MFRLLLMVAALAVPFAATAADVDHSAFDTLLKAHVKGAKLDYAGFLDDKGQLEPGFKTYLEMIEKTDPASLPDDKARLAFWINAYNAHTIAGVLRHWPGITSVSTVYPDFGFFKRADYTVGGKKYALNDIENKVIRPTFKDARIHAALNCASISCPPLAPFAFTGPQLDKQLDQVFGAFANDAQRNQIGPDGVKLSEIFNWYGGDFQPSVQAYLAKYVSDPAKKKALGEAKALQFLPYDWNLNKAK